MYKQPITDMRKYTFKPEKPAIFKFIFIPAFESAVFTLFKSEHYVWH